MHKKSTLLAGLFLTCFSAFSQVFSGDQATALYKQAEKVRMDPETNTLQSFRFKPAMRISKAAFPAWLKETLQQPTATEWREIAVTNDQLGFEHIRYQQFHHNMAVEGKVFIAHIQNGLVVSCNGEAKVLPAAAPQVSLNKQTAFHEALQLVGAKAYMWQSPAEEQMLKQMTNNSAASYYPQPKLVYVPVTGNFDGDDYVPAYKLDIYASEPMSRANIYLSAVTGQFLFKEDLIHTIDSTGNAVTRYSGTRSIKTKQTNGIYRLETNDRGVLIHTRNNNRQTLYGNAINFTDSDNFWNNRLPSGDDVATDAHWGAEVTYDYFKNRFNRNSFNNNGSPMYSYIHHSVNYNNAFWNGFAMTYGDGDGAFMSPLTSLDIVGHEFTHGVTGTSSGLIYMNQSGALNESFSDIFGAAIDFQNRGSQANYLIGEAVMVGGGAFRNMQNPNQFNDPDTYNGKHWKPANGPDNGGVHSNSGVQNFWFYLLANGGQGTNDNGASYNITGIGLTKAENIAFRNLTVYLTNSSNYTDAAANAIQAAEDLYGVCSLEARATAEAWYAVGVGLPYGLSAGFAPENDYYCATPATVNFINKSFNATSYIWDFGDGTTSTSANPAHVYTTPGTYTVKLKAMSPTPICGTMIDSVVQVSVVRVMNGLPTLAACQPTTTVGPQAGIGITKVVFNTINKSSGDALEGNKDFACNQITTLIAGNVYDLSVFTGTSAQKIKAWIDYNHDGVFDPVTELVASTNNFISSITVPVRTSATAMLNTQLRMRIATDNPANGNITPCGALLKGQYEDYTVQFVSQTAKPAADFRASQEHIFFNTAISFTDLSNFQPTSWQWSFPGGTPSTSTQQNPTGIVYASPGTYAVRLVTTNALGTDTLTRANYINVSGPTGISKDLAELNKLNVYPNPATDKVNIQYGFEGKKSVTITLVNTLGQVMLRKTATAASQLNTELDVQNVSAGVYFLRIADGNATVTRKLILQK